MATDTQSTDPPQHYVSCDYLSNCKAPVELLGIGPLLSPLPDHTSSQRAMMFSGHINQAQVVHGAEHPRLMTGFESQVGQYEFDTTKRDQGIQILAVIPRFIVNAGMYPIRDNPYYTIIYRGEKDHKVSYFQLNKWTHRSDGYGYRNIWLNKDQLNVGNYIPADLKLCTSPAHSIVLDEEGKQQLGNMYAYGTNLRVAYMSDPRVTEDACIISESAAKKLSSDAITKVSFKILPSQIPLNLYGDEDEYKFMPDIGESVKDNGILCALRSPTADTIVSDMAPQNLVKVQHLHDTVIYVPPGAEILDINVVVNRKCRTKTPREIFAQVQKYREPINNYHIRIWEAYQKAIHEGKEISPAFNTLVTDSVSSLLADNVRIPGFNKKADITLVKKKEAIEFIYITVTYRYTNQVSLGYKLTGRYGNKATVSAIVPDADMVTDEQGFNAEIVFAPETAFNRMNPGQWIEQFLNRGAEIIQRRMAQMDLDSAFNLAIEYVNDINPKWAALLQELHTAPQARQEFAQEIIQRGFYLQISPMQEGINEELILKLKEKYGITKSRVTFTVTKSTGEKVKVTSKKPVMIGPAYFMLLYKMPHMRSAGVGYENQYHSPVRPTALAKLLSPISLTPIRMGEDEFRNLHMTSGPEAPSRLIGLYANSPQAVNSLVWHLLTDADPANLEKIEMSTEQIIQTNSIIGVTKHLFATMGVDIAPDPNTLNEANYADLELPADRR